jgi:hypothetical protein
MQRIVVLVVDVDVPNRTAYGQDKTNVVIQCSWRDAPGGILHIPNAGERWAVTRQGIGQWMLDSKLDSVDQHDFVQSEMQPGDTRVDADTMHMLVTDAFMNGRGIGTTVKDNYYSDTNWATVTLSTDPATPESIHPMLNGILITPDLYDLNGRTLTFHNLMALGSLVITYQVWTRALEDSATVTSRALITGVDLYP